MRSGIIDPTSVTLPSMTMLLEWAIRTPSSIHIDVPARESTSTPGFRSQGVVLSAISRTSTPRRAVPTRASRTPEPIARYRC